MAPATFVVTLIVGVCLVVGALVLGASRHRRVRRDACPGCGQHNPPNARFCAQCGHKLVKT